MNMKYNFSDTSQNIYNYHDYKEYYSNKIDKHGSVDPLEQISNKEYKSQFPD